MAFRSRREEARLACHVATIGPSATQIDRIDSVGPAGSCTCRMSRSESLIQRRARAVATGPKLILATDPLELIEIGFPPLVTYSGSASSSSAGARMTASCPSRISARRRSWMWAATPPGVSHA